MCSSDLFIAIPAESKIHEYKHLPSEVSETYKKYIFDENINKSVDKGIKEIIKEENSNSVDDIFDLDEHKDEKSFQEHDNFREDVLKVVMRLSDIIMTIMEKDFDNGNFDVRESLNQVGFAVKEMNIEEKTQANSIRTFEESKGDIYNEKDITSLYTEPELIEYNNIFEDKDVS